MPGGIIKSLMVLDKSELFAGGQAVAGEALKMQRDANWVRARGRLLVI